MIAGILGVTAFSVRGTFPAAAPRSTSAALRSVMFTTATLVLGAARTIVVAIHGAPVAGVAAVTNVTDVAGVAGDLDRFGSARPTVGALTAG